MVKSIVKGIKMYFFTLKTICTVTCLYLFTITLSELMKDKRERNSPYF